MSQVSPAVIIGTETATNDWTFRKDINGNYLPTLLQTSGTFYTGNRWGDYSATTPDPADPQVFWTTQEYVASTEPAGVGQLEHLDERGDRAQAGRGPVAAEYLQQPALRDRRQLVRRHRAGQHRPRHLQPLDQRDQQPDGDDGRPTPRPTG